MKGTAFESLPLQTVTVLTPMAPEMSAAVIAATKRSLLTKLVARKEPLQLTIDSRRKSLPSTLNRKLLAPAVALLGGRAGPDRAVESDASDREVAQGVPIQNGIADSCVHRKDRRGLACRARIARVAGSNESVKLAPPFADT